MESSLAQGQQAVNRRSAAGDQCSMLRFAALQRLLDGRRFLHGLACTLAFFHVFDNVLYDQRYATIGRVEWSFRFAQMLIGEAAHLGNRSVRMPLPCITRRAVLARSAESSQLLYVAEGA